MAGAVLVGLALQAEMLLDHEEDFLVGETKVLRLLEARVDTRGHEQAQALVHDLQVLEAVLLLQAIRQYEAPDHPVAEQGTHHVPLHTHHRQEVRLAVMHAQRTHLALSVLVGILVDLPEATREAMIARLDQVLVVGVEALHLVVEDEEGIEDVMSVSTQTVTSTRR